MCFKIVSLNKLIPKYTCLKTKIIKTCLLKPLMRLDYDTDFHARFLRARKQFTYQYNNKTQHSIDKEQCTQSNDATQCNTITLPTFVIDPAVQNSAFQALSNNCAPPAGIASSCKIRAKKQNVFSNVLARRGLICSILLVIGLIVFINYLIEFCAVTKIGYNYHTNYHTLRKKDNNRISSFYDELKQGFVGDVNGTYIPTTPQTWDRCVTIHLGFVCSGYKSNLYLHTMLKSLLFYRHNPLHLHIVANKFSENVLRTLFDTWKVPKLNVSYYEMNPLLPDVRWVPNSHYSGLYGLLKLTFSKFMPANVNKIIVLDTDLTFISDIYDLWQLFDDFDYNKAIGLVENESDFYLTTKRTVWPAIGKGFNTGVILYRLDKLRSISWDKMWNRVAKKAAMMYGATSLGDQDIMNTVLKQYPNLLHRLPCYWNTQLSDHTTSHQCYQHSQIKVIHWNSPKKFNVVNKDGAYFRSLYTTFLEMNGDLVTTSLYDCVNDSASVETPTDVCFQFKQAKHNKWRTLLFFRNFEYIPVAHDVTFVAQLSYDRLQMIEQLSKQWEGPISFTFYVTDTEFQQALTFIDGSDVLQERSNIAYHAVFKKGDYHPINLLRNVGLKNVNTPFVFLADIDFLPMFGLHQTIRNAISSLKALNKKALIIPAFETQRYRSRFPRNKHELLQMLENKSIFTFRYDVWASGHAPTNYSRWKTAQSPYTIKWEPDFEPYVVVKKNVVEYDASFMGFGWNKVSHIMELECQNYEFIVLHNAFIVHKPHSPSYDIVKFRKDPIYRMCLQNLKEEFVEGLRVKYGRVFDKSNRHDFERESEE